MMKHFIFSLICAMFVCASSNAQSAGDKIIGNYKVDRNGNLSKVKVFKYKDGYRAQVYWLAKPNNADGTPKKDLKNPDKSKRNTLATEIVLIDKVEYDAEDQEWDDGEIYDPTKGKSFDVEITIKDAKTLCVKGKWGPFSEKMYWERIK